MNYQKRWQMTIHLSIKLFFWKFINEMSQDPRSSTKVGIYGVK